MPNCLTVPFSDPSMALWTQLLWLWPYCNIKLLWISIFPKASWLQVDWRPAPPLKKCGMGTTESVLYKTPVPIVRLAQLSQMLVEKSTGKFMYAQVDHCVNNSSLKAPWGCKCGSAISEHEWKRCLLRRHWWEFVDILLVAALRSTTAIIHTMMV